MIRGISGQYAVVATERCECSKLAEEMGCGDVALAIMDRPLAPHGSEHNEAKVAERLACADVALDHDCPDLAVAIYRRTCDEAEMHFFGDDGYCEICGAPRLMLVKG